MFTGQEILQNRPDSDRYRIEKNIRDRFCRLQKNSWRIFTIVAIWSYPYSIFCTFQMAVRLPG